MVNFQKRVSNNLSFNKKNEYPNHHPITSMHLRSGSDNDGLVASISPSWERPWRIPDIRGLKHHYFAYEARERKATTL